MWPFRRAATTQHEAESRRWEADKAPGGSSLPTGRRCDRPPAGWTCSRGYEHEGPCAAVPTDVPQVPHCDQAVLHAPGECGYCDEHPDWQQLRQLWGIAFTGHPPRVDHERPWLSEVACPSDVRRPGGANQVWPGNQPAGSDERPRSSTVVNGHWYECSAARGGGSCDAPDVCRKLAAGVELDEQQAVSLGRALAAELAQRVDAGARLYFALYHHPKAKELFGSDFMTQGLAKAYNAAQDAYMSRP